MSQEGKSVAGTPVVGIEAETLVEQWARERPDLDPTPMGICADLWRAGDRVRAKVNENLARYSLDLPGCDVVFTLRRQGKDVSLSPSHLAKLMMLSSSATTNRLDRLEKKGLIERIADPNDRRALKVRLTAEGLALVEDMVVTHVATEAASLAKLSGAEREQLLALLAKIG
ncbi:MarR family winged helix-turn-helix transcriptional regulator [Aestuariispira ectoiniformans]|uniref:MarR family winged helix-turn-helix transcriptional regulator n=1 Tax=Aestuariispira ectoiniformans TaxID=2775080 RepID=UPI00223B5872|nr:MarR family transcriptional regulator [Aestuariispira ectoiniformans]